MNTILQPDFSKYADGLMPCIIQDNFSAKVLMLGFMNEEALKKTTELNKVTFYSRSKQRLWTKGETSGNFLTPVTYLSDCDQDTILIKVIPAGPVCHTGADTCFGETNEPADFLFKLENIIEERKTNVSTGSYVSNLFEKGINKIAQKAGEEAVELIIESKDDNIGLFKEEAADLLFHYLILLKAKGTGLSDIKKILEERHTK